jgi:predicted membrane protein
MRVCWGIAFILAAVAIILNAAGVIIINGLSPGDFFLGVAFAIVLILSIPHRIWFGIFFALAGFFMIFAEPLGFKGINLWVCILVALFLSIGFSILFHKRRRHRWHEKWNRWQDEQVHRETDRWCASESTESVDGNVVHVNTSFGNVIKYINSDNLERVEAECSFGAMKLYFDNAKLRESGALIVLEVSFGSAELFIPRAWSVNNDLERSFAGVYEQNVSHSSAEKTAHVTITGDVSFSSVSIIYV